MRKSTKVITIAVSSVVALAIAIPLGVVHMQDREPVTVNEPIVSVSGSAGVLSGGITPKPSSEVVIKPTALLTSTAKPLATAKCVDALKIPGQTPRSYPSFSVTQKSTPCQYNETKFKKVMETYRNLYTLASTSATIANDSRMNATTRATYSSHAKMYLAEMVVWSALPLPANYTGNVNAIAANIMGGGTITQARVEKVSRVILWHLAYTGAAENTINGYYAYASIATKEGFGFVTKAFGISKPLGLNVYLTVLKKSKHVTKFVLSAQTAKVFVPNLLQASI